MGKKLLSNVFNIYFQTIIKKIIIKEEMNDRI